MRLFRSYQDSSVINNNVAVHSAGLTNIRQSDIMSGEGQTFFIEKQKKALTVRKIYDIVLLPREKGAYFFVPFSREAKITAISEVPLAMRVKVTLACTECKQRNYNTIKNKKNNPERLEMKKHCRFCNKHTVHKETK